MDPAKPTEPQAPTLPSQPPQEGLKPREEVKTEPMEQEGKPTVEEEAKVAEVAVPPRPTTPTEKRAEISPETPNFNDNPKEGSQL